MKLFKILSVLLLSLSVSSAYADKIQVGFVYVGPVGDHGWTYMHDQGRIMAEEKIEFVEWTEENSMNNYKKELKEDLQYHQSETKRIKRELKELEE